METGIGTKEDSSMKKIYAFLMMAAALAACMQMEQPSPIEQPEETVQTYTMTVEATKSGDKDTKALSLGGKTLSATWAQGERVTVRNVTKSTDLGGYLEAQSNGSSTTLKGDLTGTIEPNDKLVLKFLSPDYSSQDGTLKYIAAHCDYAESNEITVTVVSGNRITASDATFTNQQAIIKFTMKDKGNNDAAISASAFTITDGTSTVSLSDIPAATYTANEASNVLYVAFPAAGTAKTINLTATVGTSIYTYEKTGVTFANSQYYEITVKMTYDPLATPLTFEAKTAVAEVSFGANGPWGIESPTVDVEYSLNGGAWTSYTGTIALSKIGDKVSFRGNNAKYYPGNQFSCSGDCYIYGNIMSLVSKEGYATATTLTESDAFAWLFAQNSSIYNHASKTLVLPATTLSAGCYYSMFYRCTNLTTAPELPAETLADNCYKQMFQHCSGLTTAPELPAEVLAEGCYESMFWGCTSLTTVPTSLPAMTLATNCYSHMFYGCTSLTTAPTLPATILASSCYASLFSGCSSLTTVQSSLPATTLIYNCYGYMFNGCTNLTTAPELPATTLAGACYESMFNGCTGLTTAPALPATTLANQCYKQMFYGCTNLNSVTCLATNISASNCTKDWLGGVAATGTFTKAASMSSWTLNSASGIPSGWTVIPVVPGKFSVSSSKQVFFAPGNLQYKESEGWRFAENQHDAIGSWSTSDWVDLFGWNTWGDVNDNWFALSDEQWRYLLDDRTVNGGTDNGYSYTFGQKVSGILGLVLYPDNYNGDTYAGSNWESFEAAGCVFLPAAGFRMDSDVYYVGDYGYYWSNTLCNEGYAYGLYFSNNFMSVDGYVCDFGQSVRLVRDAN